MSDIIEEILREVVNREIPKSIKKFGEKKLREIKRKKTLEKRLEEVKAYPVKLKPNTIFNTSHKFIDSLYLYLHKFNLLNYLSGLIILPNNYFGSEKRIYKDIQSNKDFLILSDNKFSLKGDLICLEVYLTEKEIAKLKTFRSNYFRYYSPIPFSRIRKILVKDKNAKQELIDKSKSGNSYIINKEIIQIENAQNSINFDKDFYEITIDVESNISQKEIDLYDKILGCLAFVKSLDVFYFNKEFSYQNISKTLITILNTIEKLNQDNLDFENPAFYECLLNLRKKGNETLNWLLNRINSYKALELNELKPLIELLVKKFPKLNQSLKFIFTSLNNSSINIKEVLNEAEKFKGYEELLIIIVYLFKYGTNPQNQINLARIEIPKNCKRKYAGYVFAVLGYFYGYKVLWNYEKHQTFSIENTRLFNFHKQIFPVNDGKPSLKFELDSLFDYKIIESVYQFVFNKESIEKIDFNYLDFKKQKINTSIIDKKYYVKKFDLFSKEVFFIDTTKANIEIDDVNKLKSSFEIGEKSENDLITEINRLKKICDEKDQIIEHKDKEIRNLRTKLTEINKLSNI